MGLFNKKQKEEKKDNEYYFESNKKNISKNLYKIILKEKTGNTVSTIANFQAKRWFEADSEIPFLRNDKMNFLEVLPELDIHKYNISIKDIDAEIEDLEAQLDDINKLEDPQAVIEDYGNPKNIEFKLLTLKAKKNALKYDDRVYMTFGINGEKEFTFIRDGSHFIPQCIDNETFTAFYPPDSKKKTFAFTHRNKQLKLGMGHKLMTTALAATWIFGLLFLMGTGYLFFQMQDKYSEHEIVKAKASCVETAADMVDSIERQSNEITKIYQAINKELNKPQTVIDGVQPK